MFAEKTLNAMINRFNSFPELRDAIIIYESGNQTRILRKPSQASVSLQSPIIIIEEVQKSIGAPKPKFIGPVAPNSFFVRKDSTLDPNLHNISKIQSELVGAGLSCGLTIVSALGVLGSGAAEIPTGGMSTFLMVAAWGGLVTGYAQCLNGIYRVSTITANPSGTELNEMDENKIYTRIILALDVVGVASGAASLPSGVKELLAVLSRQRSFVARGLSVAKLKSMNQKERLQIVKQLVAEAGKTPEGREALMKAAQEAKIPARIFETNGALSVNRAQKMVKIISDETARRIASAMRDLAGTAIGFGVNALDSDEVGSASGSINLVIHIIAGDRPDF